MYVYCNFNLAYFSNVKILIQWDMVTVQIIFVNMVCFEFVKIITFHFQVAIYM